MQDAGFVRQAFASIARRYVLTNHVLSLGTDCLWRRTTSRRIAELAPKRVLDLATGSGDLAQAVQVTAYECQLALRGTDVHDGQRRFAADEAPAPAPPAASSAPAAATEDENVKASPVARRVAADKGVDLATVAGTGSPDVAIVSQQSRGTPIWSSWVATPARGRGEFVTRTTLPPCAR